MRFGAGRLTALERTRQYLHRKLPKERAGNQKAHVSDQKAALNQLRVKSSTSGDSDANLLELKIGNVRSEKGARKNTLTEKQHRRPADE